MKSNDLKGQTGIEAILITGIIISAIAILGAFYFSNSSDITMAVIILKTDLLKEFGNLNNKYDINGYAAGHSLEPTILADGTTCFEVRTSPTLSNADKAALTAKLAGIEQKIKDKTRFELPKIKLEDDTCP